MITVPASEVPLVIRTDFSDQEAWEACRSVIETPSTEGPSAIVEFLDDPSYRDITVQQFLELGREEEDARTFLLLTDRQTLASDEYPILVLELAEEGRGRTFRVVADELWGVAANLDMANMDFEEFADAVDEDGVFRGFA
jgi:hypothetical protein